MDDRAFIECSPWGILYPDFVIPVYDYSVLSWHTKLNAEVHMEKLLNLRYPLQGIAKKIWKHKDNIGFHINVAGNKRLCWYGSTEWANGIEVQSNISCYNYIGEGNINIRITVQELEHEFWGII